MTDSNFSVKSDLRSELYFLKQELEVLNNSIPTTLLSKISIVYLESMKKRIERLNKLIKELPDDQ